MSGNDIMMPSPSDAAAAAMPPTSNRGRTRRPGTAAAAATTSLEDDMPAEQAASSSLGEEETKEEEEEDDVAVVVATEAAAIADALPAVLPAVPDSEAAAPAPAPAASTGGGGGTAGSTSKADSVPLTVTELRDHLIALYNSTDSIRKYCRSNGIPSKRTTLSQAMADSGLAKRKQAAFPFDRFILKMIDDYSKTYSTRKSVSAKMTRDQLKAHLVAMYKTKDSIRKYCKDHDLTSRRSTMTRAFSESGLAQKKENREPLDEAVDKAIEDYLDLMPSMTNKSASGMNNAYGMATNKKQPPKIALKAAAKQGSTAQQTLDEEEDDEDEDDNANEDDAATMSTAAASKDAPDEVQLEYMRSLLRTTPPGVAIQVMRETTFESVLRDVKDPDCWWMITAGGPTSVTTADLLQWKVRRPDVGLCEVANMTDIPVAFEELAKERAQGQRQVAVDKLFRRVNGLVVNDLVERVSDETLKETLKEELKDVDILAPYKEQLQDMIEGPFKTSLTVTHEGETNCYNVKVGGLWTTVSTKQGAAGKKRKADAVSSTPSKASKPKVADGPSQEEQSPGPSVAV